MKNQSRKPSDEWQPGKRIEPPPLGSPPHKSPDVPEDDEEPDGIVPDNIKGFGALRPPGEAP